MQIIIPMSGHGQRFLEAGYHRPKPLIEVDGSPMVTHVISMFPGETNFKFICNERHLQETDLERILKKKCPEGEVFCIPEHKLGPVYAVDKIRDAIDENEPTIVSYCDYYAYWDYRDFVKKVMHRDVDGCVACYRGFHPHLLLPNLYAGVLAEKEEYLLEIREKFSYTKNKMDTWQSSGTYFFKTGALVKHYFRKLLDLKITCKDEFYVSLVYNLMREDGLKTLIYEQPYFCQWGTPEDLRIYQSWSNYFAQIMSQDTKEGKL